MRPEETDATALWVAHTWAIDAAYFTPYMSITSAVSESGKSTLLSVLERLVQRPWKTGRVTPAVLARRIDGEQPTLLLDEVDAAFASSRNYGEMLRGILNDGFARGGIYSIAVGQGYRDYSVFGPKAIAGIGKLPDTIASRSIPIRLRRRKAEEHVDALHPWELDELATPLCQQLEHWASDNVATLKRAIPTLPVSLSDRSRNVWTPLAAIGDAAGCDWPDRVNRAASKLAEHKQDRSDRDETRVLTAVREAFDETNTDRLFTLTIAQALVATDVIAPEKASTEKVAGHAVKRALQPFEISPPHKLRIGLRSGRGYTRSQFEEAWERYL